MEEDAAQRARKRKEKASVRTSVWKEKGNVEFKAGNYRKAIEHYTEGMAHREDKVALYTNRAQAYNRLGEYANALKDCAAAIFLGPTTINAYIHRGLAYVGQRKYNAAIKSYEKILKFDQKHEKIVHKFIYDAVQAKKSAKSEAPCTRSNVK